MIFVNMKTICYNQRFLKKCFTQCAAQNKRHWYNIFNCTLILSTYYCLLTKNDSFKKNIKTAYLFYSKFKRHLYKINFDVKC